MEKSQVDILLEKLMAERKRTKQRDESAEKENSGAKRAINPPSDDERCWVCGRSVSELTPFGGPGDPLEDDFTGELLVKTSRPAYPYVAEAGEAWERAEKETNCEVDPLPWFIETYGEGKGKRLYYEGQLQGWMGSSWECRDCIILDDDEYFEKRRPTLETINKKSSGRDEHGA